MKKETQGYICPQTKIYCDDECCVSAEDCHIEAGFGIVSDCEPPKQETLEEAAESYVKNFAPSVKSAREIGFIDGAKYQAERMYSEEDMKDYANYRLLIKKALNPKEWFEKFKNK